MKLVALLLILVVGLAWPVAVYAAGPSLEAPELQPFNPMTGAIDLQRGGIDAQVAFERAEVALNARLTDSGPEGQFSIATPFPFTATVTAANGNVDAQVCGVVGSQAASVGGGLGSGLHIQFRNADTEPNPCSTKAIVMAPNIVVAQATPTANGPVLSDSLAVGLRRLIVLGIICGLLFLFIPGLWKPVSATARTSPWSRLGLGLCLLITLPVIGALLFMAGLSLGLWWFGLLVLLVFVCILAAGITLSGVTAGAWLLERIRDPRVPPIVGVAAGLLALTVLGLLPSVGAAVTVLAMVYGAGALVLLPRAVGPQLQTAAVVDGAIVALPAQDARAVAGAESQANGVTVAAPTSGVTAATNGAPPTLPTSGGPSATEPTHGAPAATEPTGGGPSAQEPTKGAPSATEPTHSPPSAAEPTTGA